MGVYKEGKNWKVQVYYKDWQGNRKRKQKRGFRTKGEAKEWERDFLQQQSQGVDIEFGNFLEIYYKDMDVRLRENTMYTKRYIINLKIKPYFEKKILSEITVADVRAWQNELLTYKDKNGKGYSPTYLKTVNCQLTAIFNYAMRYYNLQDNPCRKAGAIGKSKGEPKDFWMQEEFNAFLETVSDKPETRMAFLLLYWTGMRIGAGGMNVTGAVSGTKARFINRGGKLVIANTADKVAADRVDVVNYGDGGASIGGINAENGLYVVNHKGNLSVDGHVTTGDDATISIRNAETAGKLAVGSNGHIDGQGKVALRNQGANGMTIDGKVTNDNALGNAETSIINENGALLVNGKINNNGNMAIKNTGSGMTISKNAVVTNEGQLKVKNYGAGGMTIVGDVNNTGNVTFYNDAGKMKLATTEDGTKAGNITNEDGRLIIWSRNNSTGISAASSSKIINNGNGNSLAIKHTGTTAAGSKGLDLQGTIRNDGETAINNYSGDMYISGNIQSDGSLGIINRAGAGKADFASAGSITSDKNINIKNYGSGDMTVNNTITNNGRLNIIANTGKLNLGGTVHNDSNGALDDNNGFYAVSRDQGTGINLSSGFKADGAGQNLIKNISGSEGLRYEGNINASGSQTELYNQKGNMTVGGTLATTGDGKVVVLNKGDGMKLDGIITSEKDAKIVNKGLEHAENNAKVTTPNKIWFYEKLK